MRRRRWTCWYFLFLFLAGIASYVKRIAPHIKIITVETFDSNAMTKSLQLGSRVALKQVGLFADGAAGNRCGVIE